MSGGDETGWREGRGGEGMEMESGEGMEMESGEGE